MKNSFHTGKARKYKPFIIISMIVMFWLFCIPYLSITCRYQLTLTAETAHIYYNRWMGAVLITLVLQLLQLFSFWQFRPSLKFHIVSYLPSFGLLTFITHTGGVWEKIKNVQQIGLYVGVAFTGVLLIGLLLRIRRKRITKVERYPIFSIHKWINYTILLLFLLTSATSFFAGNTDILQREMAVDYYLKKKQYGRAAGIGIKNDKPSATFLQLHNYAIAKLGEMEGRLFEVPQLYGNTGLFPDTTVHKSCRSLFTIAEELNEEDRLLIPQYQPASLLLEKDLMQFVSYAAENGLFSVKEEIPRYYAEALLLYMKQYGEQPEGMALLPEGLSDRFEQFLTRREEQLQEMSGKGGKGSTSLIRREFGNTYWWYFFYN